MFGDKQYAKQPYKYPTPENIPEDTGCRTFRIPSDSAWFALFMGALYPLTQPDSFQQNEGALSVETTAEIFSDLIEETYENAEFGCEACVMPGGQPIVRLNEDGEFEQLIDGDWLPPEGEYEVPPTEPREGGTPDDKRCLAAANATNVMKVLYETLADDYAEGLTLLEAIAHFIAVVAALILLPGGLIAAAIALALVLFRIMFETAEFVTADYWSEPFDEKFQCALFECSSVDGEGVVTFDYNCFQMSLSAKINAAEDPFEVVLWGQIQAMLMFLGVDGLNLAGGTTAIATADCSACGVWCWANVFSEGAGEDYSAHVTPYSCTAANYSSNWNSADCRISVASWSRIVWLDRTFTSTNLTRVVFNFTITKGSIPDANTIAQLFINGSSVASIAAGSIANGSHAFEWTGYVAGATSIEFYVRSSQAASATYSGSVTVTGSRFEGTVDNPFNAESNCEV